MIKLTDIPLRLSDSLELNYQLSSNFSYRRASPQLDWKLSSTKSINNNVDTLR